jgi:geranylgeranyl diphosphate synthase type I
MLLRALAATRDLVEPGLREAVATLRDEISRISAYHFGWSDADGGPAPGTGGRMVRQALVLWTAKAVGAAPGPAVPAAVAVELVHGGSLLHDDIIDGDAVRRGRPTVRAAFGLPAAPLAGDALFSLSMKVLTGLSAPVAVLAVSRLADTIQDLVRGEYSDAVFEGRRDVTMGECLEMSSAKTAALLATSCALGALVGGADRARTEALAGFGAHLGMAFQFVDDLLGIWGDPAVTGKPVDADLSSRKMTAPVVAAFLTDRDR